MTERQSSHLINHLVSSLFFKKKYYAIKMAQVYIWETFDSILVYTNVSQTRPFQYKLTKVKTLGQAKSSNMDIYNSVLFQLLRHEFSLASKNIHDILFGFDCTIKIFIFQIVQTVYFRRKEQPSVSLALPPVGWQRTLEQEPQVTTV